MPFPEKLRQIRLMKDLRQKDVADYLGVTISTYCGYETGKRQPDVQKLQKIAEFLGVSVSELLWSGDGPAPEPLRCVATPRGAYIVSDDEFRHTAQNVLDGVHLEQRSKALLAAFDQLNAKGQSVAVERVEELGKVPEYKK